MFAIMTYAHSHQIMTGLCSREKVKEGEPSLYNSCVINTCKEMTCYSDFPIPREFPNFMSHKYFKRYLDLYADNFKLRKHISFHHSVQSVETVSYTHLTLPTTFTV